MTHCSWFTFAEMPPYDISGIKPYHIRTFCGCKCVAINDEGFGKFLLCKIHEAKVWKLNTGDVIVPSIKVDIPVNRRGEVELFLGYLKRELKRRLNL